MTDQRIVSLMLDWRRGGDSFTCKLFTLFMKADPSNFKLLAKGFPREAALLNEWREADSEEIFFNRYGMSWGTYSRTGE